MFFAKRCFIKILQESIVKIVKLQDNICQGSKEIFLEVLVKINVLVKQRNVAQIFVVIMLTGCSNFIVLTKKTF